MPELRFEPINPKHSIEEFFLGIRFARQTTESTNTRAVVEARRVARLHNLPAENQQSNLLVSIDPMTGMQPRPGPAFSTFFQRYNAAGIVEEEARIERNFVAYRTGSYDRWSEISGKLEAIILPLAQIYAEEVPLLDSVLLQCTDRFTASGQEAVDWSELFRRSTPWVASGMIATRTAWHSHCGRFESLPNAGTARRLVNVNVDVGEPTARPGVPPTQSLAILTLCTVHFTRPGLPPTVLDPASFASEMRTRFDVLHDRAKEILKEVLADEYLTRIGMKTTTSAI